ncbi:substrate-binding domain-containing protein [Nocardia spumae]|uniref:substrate-binding domain-containing protein n=1 Tax=Nocardia spumae TaxID=2887190 RepID=UPI001D147FA8|nr:substrate-binding domain-containing protein [Nocardia spumae]
MPDGRSPGALRPTVDIALVVPLSGPAGMFGPSCEACAALAVADLDAAGGILDRPVRLHAVDAGAPPPVLAARVRRLVSTGAVDAVVGWHLSDARRAITPYTAGRVPYIYTTFYEGGEDSAGVYMVGETPERQLFPALRWLRAEYGRRRWCIVGNDYIWPRETARRTTEFASVLGIEIVGSVFVPLGGRNFRPVLEAIRDSAADAVLMLMVGADGAAFNRAYARAGLDADRIRLGMMIGEDVLYASGASGTRGLFTACGYLEGIASAPALEFGARYARLLGADAPALSNIGESCYEGMLLLAALAEQARSLEVGAIARAAARVGYRGPRGEVRVHGAHTTQPVYLAEVDALDFGLLADLTPRGRANSAGE